MTWTELKNILSVGADVGALVASLAAVGLAYAAWRVAKQTFTRDHRPMVRVVATFSRQHDIRNLAEFLHAGDPAALQLDEVILKNIGRGPGLTPLVYDPATKEVIGDGLECVDPLGTGEDEASRLGRARLTLRRPMVLRDTYELYSQDVVGDWHLTRFRLEPNRIECTFVPEVKQSSVPKAVQLLATVARP